MNVTAGLLLYRALAQHAGRVALVDRHGQETFGQLEDHIRRIGHGLAAFDIGPGDRVGLLSYNRREVLHAWTAFERAAVVRVVLHSHFDFTDHVSMLRQVGAKALVFDTRFADAVAEHRQELTGLTLFAVGDNPPSWATPWEQIEAAGDDSPLRVDVDENAPFVIQPTSGTTGTAKPWIATHRGWQTAMDQDLQYYDTYAPGIQPVGPDDVALHSHALQWSSGWHLLYPMMIRGGRNVILDDRSFEPQTVLDTLVTERVTAFMLPAPLLTPILDLVDQGEPPAHSLRRLFLFFATPELLARTTILLGPVWSSNYCSTEQGALTTQLGAHDAAANPARTSTVGKVAAPLVDLAVVDQQGHRVPAGTTGEIVVRSPVTNSGYWGMPDTTAASFFDGGWFRTGDVGSLDEAGYLTYGDRAGDAIPTPHGVVYPHRVEAAVLRHPDVANCGVVHDGTDLVAAVLLKSGATATPDLPEEILAVARPGLDEHEIPRVVLVTSLPMVLDGAKVQRNVLRRQLTGEPA